jgi:HEAT repeat protein
MGLEKINKSQDIADTQNQAKPKPRHFFSTSLHEPETSSVFPDKGKNALTPDELAAEAEQLKRFPFAENGQRAPNLIPLSDKSTLDEPRMLGGMLRGDRASGYVSPKVLTSMSADEQIMWFMDGGLAKALGPHGDRAFVPAIFSIIENKQMNSGVRRGAAEALGTILAAHPDKTMTQRMMDMLSNKQIDSSVRRGAAEALGPILAAHPDKNITKQMVNMLFNEQRSWKVRQGVAKALGPILTAHPDKGMALKMMYMLFDEQIDSSVRRGAAEALGTILAEHPDKYMTQQMMGELFYERMDDYVRKDVAKAIGTILAAHPDKTMNQQMMDMLSNKQMQMSMLLLSIKIRMNSNVRLGAAEALGTILAAHPDKTMNQQMMNTLFDEQIDSGVRRGVAKALGPILAAHPDKTMNQQMMNTLFDEQIDSGVRRGVAKALGPILAAYPDKTMIQKMMNMLFDEQIDSGVRRGVAKALGPILAAHPDKTMNQQMMKALSDEQIDSGVRRGVAKALGPILAAHPDKTMTKQMMNTLSDEQIDSGVRRGVAKALGPILAAHHDKTMNQQMMDMLSNKQIDWQVRLYATEELGTIIKIRTKQQIDNDMRAGVDQRVAPTPSSSEASSSQRAGELRSPEQMRPADRRTDSRRPGGEQRVERQVGNYRLKEVLGSGSFAKVYLSENVDPSKPPAAVKVFKTVLMGPTVNEFFNEVQILKQLKHEHIIRIYDFNVTDDHYPFMAMELAPDGTLAQLHPLGTQVPYMQISNCLDQLGSGLDYAHGKNIVHRDLKPANLLVVKKPNGEIVIKIADFGLAKVHQNSSSQVTQEGIVGTFAYMPPEQMGGKAEFKSDQYSVGVMLYQWLSGHLPFVGGTPYELMAKHMMAPPEPLSGVPQAIQDVVFRALAKNPDDRFGSVTELAQAFKRAVVCESGRQLFQSGRYQEALKEFDRILGLDAQNTFALASRGQTYQRLGRHEKASADYQNALALDSSLVWVRQSLNEVRQKMR